MQAIMLAAGMGKRLGKNTQENTKCMISVAGKKLIDWAIEAVENAGITKFIIVVGYKSDNLINYINKNYSNSKVKFVFIRNEEYETTNNIYSFYLAREYLVQDDTILMESDLIYEKVLIKNLCESQFKNIAAVARYKSWMDGTVVLCNDEGKIVQFVDKNDMIFDGKHEYLKTVNVYKFSKSFLKDVYLPFLSAYMQAYGKNNYYETVLKVVAHLSMSELMAYEIGDIKWYEIDDIQDLDIANILFSAGQEKYKLLSEKFGGYWRYPEIKDFCYLVNPYFPPKQFVEKLKREFETLLIDYPSGLDTQNMNAGRMFNVDPAYILVGNGAAELINTIGSVARGKIGLNLPTFNEYRRCFSNCDFEIIDNSKSEYDFDICKIKKVCDKVNILCIVTPDNPSGKMMLKEQMFEVMEYCKIKDIMLIVDESFADFADPDLKYTLINDEILKDFPNLIVIKSISKSYGVPGLRLGILACGNQLLLKKIRSAMPIWNINSFGEYFLQTFNLFAKEYKNACEKIATERKWFITELSKIEKIKVYDSQANYILVELSRSSSEFCSKMLNRFNILVKDLSNKDYFYNRNFIRVAVRDRQDNIKFLQAIREVII